MTLWLDDIQKQCLTFIDNDTRTLTEVRLGAQGVDANTSGTIYFDDFESRRFSYIGTLTDPGVDDPQATNQAGWFARTYQYSATIPHAVTNVTLETGSPDTYSYDANGNMTCRVENGVTYSQTYNAENRISSIAKRTGDCTTGTILESWSFAYDGDGVRVMTAHFTGASGTPDSTTAYYMGGAYEVKDSAVKKYYSIAGMMIAVHDGTALQYLLTDHLGSTVAVTNSSGTLTSQQRYLPFGAPRTIPNSPILGTDFTYTGQRKLDDGMGGVMDYKARFYSPALMRFLQPDTIIPDQFNPQSWNRFSYVVNRPIVLNDPDGHCAPACHLVLIPVVEIAFLALVALVAYNAIVDIGQATELALRRIPANKNIRDSQVVQGNRSPYPGYYQPPRAPKPDPILEMLTDTAKAVYLLCKKNPALCLLGGAAGLASQLVGENDAGKPNPYHCNVNPSDQICNKPTEVPIPSSTPTSTPTTTPTSTPTTTPTSTPTTTPTSTPTTTPTSTPTLPPMPTITPTPSIRRLIPI